MQKEVYECDNRRSEVNGEHVIFKLMTGNVRRSSKGVWKCVCEDVKHARRLAKRWAFSKKLGAMVV